MSFVRTQYTTVYQPRPISKDVLKSLVGELESFKAGLQTTSRLIKSRAISHEKITTLQGPECWKVVDPHPLSGLEHLEIELLITESNDKSCELHVEFRANHIFLSVSDIGTSWGRGVHEEMRHILDKYGISTNGFREKIHSSYGFIVILQNIILAVSVAAFSTFLAGHGNGYLYTSVALFFSGAVPAFVNVFRHFFPPKKQPIVQEAAPKRMSFPFTEASAVISFIGAIISLAKELL